MDPFVIGFISFVLGMAAVVTVVAFARRGGSDRPLAPEDWEVQMAASSLI